MYEIKYFKEQVKISHFDLLQDVKVQIISKLF